jgi:4-oxalocrotonate tautomerase
MPYVKIEVTREGVTREQKQQLIKGVTDLLSDVLNKDPQFTHVVIQEVDLDNWGHAGEQASVQREKGISPDRK